MTHRQIENKNATASNPEQAQKKHRAGKFISRLGLAALCIIPPADLAASDTVGIHVYNAIEREVKLPSKPLERGLEITIMGSLLTAQSVGLGQILTKSKKMNNAFDDFEAYREHNKKKQRGFIKRATSTVFNAPFSGFTKAGKFFEKTGNKMSERKSKIARGIGHLTVDLGQVNSMGTSGMIAEETMLGKPPSIRRQLYLGGLISGTWLGVAEGVRTSYRNIAFLRPPMAAVGHAFETLTSVDFSHPMNTPTATIAMSVVGAGLAYTGWKIEEFRQQREELLHVDPSNIVNLQEVVNPAD